MSRYARQYAAAAAQFESECECDDHARRPAGPDDGDLYADGWTVGGKRQETITVEAANRRYRAYLEGVSK